MKQRKTNMLILTILLLGGCSQYENVNNKIIENLKINETYIDENSIVTRKLDNQELAKLYPNFEFYKSMVHTTYMEYPKLELIALYNSLTDQISLLPSMSFKQIDPDFLNQFEGKTYKTNESKFQLLQGFSKIYKQLEGNSKLTIIDSTNFNYMTFSITINGGMKEKFYLNFEENKLVDFDLEFIGVPVH